MKSELNITLLGILIHLGAAGSAFLPEGPAYDPAVTPPDEFMGYAIGSRHLTHAELVAYLHHLDRQSNRMEAVEYGRTHGNRPLLQLVISSPSNLARLEEIRAAHLSLIDPEQAANLDTGRMPVVVDFNYSIHGNEPSGANAAAVVAYHLAAATGGELETLLANTVILLDPCLNPDGLDRFANWTNAWAGRNPNPDPNTREHVEDWPGSRGNSYFFDLNRDWMLLTQPESRGRLQQYNQWLPNFVLDFHEMETNSTYFFQPGVRARAHPLIPDAVHDLTERTSLYFAEALDATGSLYFTQERFDDFYMGKGSTMPDLKGAVGILFEQASSRGVIQDSQHGPVSFAFTIQNQVTVSLAVLRAAVDLRVEFLEHMRSFFRESADLAAAAGFAGYRFFSPGDPQRAAAFAATLHGHGIEARPVAGGDGWFVPLRQPHYRYLLALVEQRREFKENIFYDITAWTLPLAYNLEWESMAVAPPTSDREDPLPPLEHGRLGYLVDWASLLAPRTLLDLLQADVLVKVAREPFTLDSRAYGHGTLFVPVSLQPEKAEAIHAILAQAVATWAVAVTPVSTFLTAEGIDLGSNRMARVEAPRILIAAGPGIDTARMGTAWHLLDVLHDYPVTLARPDDLARLDLSAYTALLLPGSWGGSYPDPLAERLKSWVKEGGTLVCLGNAATWAINKSLVALTLQEKPADGAPAPPARRPFSAAEDDAAAERIRGAIFQTEVDVTHPLAYGYSRDRLPVFVAGETFLNPSKNRYQSPLVFTAEPLLAGYASPENLARIAAAAAAAVEPQGKGAVILFGHEPAFRASWRGTEKLLLNALLFGQLMQ